VDGPLLYMYNIVRLLTRTVIYYTRKEQQLSIVTLSTLLGLSDMCEEEVFEIR